MSSKDTTTQSSPDVGDLATEQATLSRVALIGTFGSPTSRAAILRDARGNFSRISVGDRAVGGIVTAIGDTQVVIAQRGKTKVLKLPEA